MALVAILLAAIAVGLLTYQLVRSAYKRPDNFPPGPPSWPIWGTYVQLLLENYNFPYKVLDDMTRRYKSKLLGFHFGPLPAVAVSDHETIKEAMNNPHLQGRISNIAIKQRMPNKDLGINFLVGPEWMEQRRFTLRYLRDFGFGRRSQQLESEIEAELRDLVELIQGSRNDKAVVRPSPRGPGSLVLLPDALFPSFINGFLPVVAGSRLPRAADAVARRLGQAGLQAARASDVTGGLLTLHASLASVAPKRSGYLDTVQSADVLLAFSEKLIKDHEKTYSDDCIRDFIDRYLQEIKERNQNGEQTTFSTEQLAVSLFDTFLPASMVQSTALTWALLYVAHHPEVQQRMQDELDSVVGCGRLPTLDDRPNLPYTEATLRETMRIQTLLPIGIPHIATEDTTLQGYTIKKGTGIVTNLYSMHMDKDLWGDPEKFRPERFLGDNGKIGNKDYSLPFSFGKRVCPGETFARQNMFLALATLMQNFSIKGEGLPPLKSNIPGAIETSPAFWATFEPR